MFTAIQKTKNTKTTTFLMVAVINAHPQAVQWIFDKLDLDRKIQQLIKLIDIIIKRNNVEFLEKIFEIFNKELKDLNKKSRLESQHFMFGLAPFNERLFDKAFAANCTDIICSLLRFWRHYNGYLVFCHKPENADILFKLISNNNLRLLKEIIRDFPRESSKYGSALSFLQEKQQKQPPDDFILYQDICSILGSLAREVKTNPPPRSFSHNFFQADLLEEKCKHHVIRKNLNSTLLRME